MSDELVRIFLGTLKSHARLTYSEIALASQLKRTTVYDAFQKGTGVSLSNLEKILSVFQVEVYEFLLATNYFKDHRTEVNSSIDETRLIYEALQFAQREKRKLFDNPNNGLKVISDLRDGDA